MKRPSVLALIVASTVLGSCGGQVATPPPSPLASSSIAAQVATASPVSTNPPASSAPTTSFAAGAKTLRTLTDASLAGSSLVVGREIAANDAYTSHAATYTSDGLTISAVLHEPLSAGPHPGVVLVHGFVDPAQYTTGGELQREQDALARAGYVVLYTDLRGLAGSDAAPAGAPDLDMGSIDDVVNAIEALSTSRLPGLDGDRIGLLGHSLGGLLVLDVLVAKPGLVDAVVAFAPSGTDAFENVQRYLSPDDPLYRAVIEAHGTPETNPGYWADVSPRTFVDQVQDPLLIVHGDADADVPIAGSEKTVALWKGAGKDVEFITLKGEEHVFEARWDEAMAAVTAFFKAKLD